MNILHNNADAEECVNDTYLKVWQTIPPKTPNPLKPYLAHIVRNFALSLYRKKHAKKRSSALEIPLSELEECIPSPASDFDLAMLLNDFVGGLNDLERKLFVGRYWYAYDLSTLSRAYGLSKEAIAQRLYQTRKQLRSHLEKGGYQP